VLIEYVLNSCWLLLFVPAFWIWRRRTLSVRKRHHCSLQRLLALVCVVFLLFPVISASDDLHAMRPEMEESSSSKRTLKQALDHRADAQCHCAPLAARSTALLVVLPPDEASTWSLPKQDCVAAPACLSVLSSRAPPALFAF
jgi:hypothetical protein